MISYQLTSTQKELEEILALQHTNLPKNLSLKEQQQEGFVSVEHTLALLQKMHSAHPHIIAKHQNKVIGYALCMLPNFRDEIALLAPMFKEIDQLINTFKHPLKYVVMGQICIDKSHRKKGVFKNLYEYMKQTVAPNYNAIITEVDVTNHRSSKAHKKIGFEVLKEYKSSEQHWELIVLYL